MIEVRIDPLDYPYEHISDTTYEIWVIDKLKDAGIPIKGTLVFKIISSGILEKRTDEKTGYDIYKWYGPNETMPIQGHNCEVL